MIQFANRATQQLVRQMWKICFDDSDEFLDLYFQCKYQHTNTLIYFEDGEAVASLQMLPYTITFCQQEIPFAYLAGLCTLPEHRKRGYMARLIDRAHKIIAERKIPLSILVPAEEWLYGFYEKYGYQQVFDNGKEPIYPLKQLLVQHTDLNAAYKAYDALYRYRDFCVQKTFDDFMVIVKEQIMDGFPEKYDIAGMARIIDKDVLKKLFLQKNSDISLFPDIQDERLLCRLLFGYRIDELGEPYKSIFPLNHPIMNQMLE